MHGGAGISAQHAECRERRLIGQYGWFCYLGQPGELISYRVAAGSTILHARRPRSNLDRGWSTLRLDRTAPCKAVDGCPGGLGCFPEHRGPSLLRRVCLGCSAACAGLPVGFSAATMTASPILNLELVDSISHSIRPDSRRFGYRS